MRGPNARWSNLCFVPQDDGDARIPDSGKEPSLQTVRQVGPILRKSITWQAARQSVVDAQLFTLALLTIVTEGIPWVRLEDRVEISHFGEGIYRVIAHWGFKQRPHVPNFMQQCRLHNVDFTSEDTTYFLSRLSLQITGRHRFAGWRRRLFAWMMHNSHDASAYLQALRALRKALFRLAVNHGHGDAGRDCFDVLASFAAVQYNRQSHVGCYLAAALPSPFARRDDSRDNKAPIK